MKLYKIIRITLGLGLVSTGVYTGNTWFYLGIIPLAMGFINYCPLEARLGGCDEGTCEDGSCCSSSSEEKKNSISPLSGFSATAPVEKNCCAVSGTIKIEILGTGCAKCIALQKIVEGVVSGLEGEFKIEKVEDIEKIMSYSVLSTPGFVVNGEVKSSGKLLSKQEVKDLLNGTIAKIEENSKCC